MIIAILVIFSLVINTSFAASSEKLETYKGSISSNYDKKVSTINYVSKFNHDSSKKYFKFNIKKLSNKYKIKYISAKYFVYDNETGSISFFYKNIMEKQNNLKINDLSNVLYFLG